MLLSQTLLFFKMYSLYKTAVLLAFKPPHKYVNVSIHNRNRLFQFLALLAPYIPTWHTFFCYGIFDTDPHLVYVVVCAYLPHVFLPLIKS